MTLPRLEYEYVKKKEYIIFPEKKPTHKVNSKYKLERKNKTKNRTKNKTKKYKKKSLFTLF
jgi:hypothetical protein